MNKCIIVGACKESLKDFIYDKDDFIIASDGGYSFLKEKGWKKEKDYVVIVNKSDCNKFSAKQAMKDFELLGKMNVQLDKIVQAHAIAKGYDTGKEQKTQ